MFLFLLLSLLSVLIISTVPLVTGCPVVLSVTVTFIVVFLTLLFVTVAVVRDSLCVTVSVIVSVVLLYSCDPGYCTVIVFSPTGKSLFIS